MTEDLSEFRALTEVQELRSTVHRLEGQLRRAKAKTDDLVAATMAGARDAMLAMGPLPAVPAPEPDTRRHGAEVALWHLTDWQGAKATATYSTPVMRERVLRFCEKAERITDVQRADHPVKECVIAFGGDMIEGLFNFPQQPFEIDATVFGQFIAVAHLEAEVVRRALSYYERVTVVAEWGNHGRIGSKRAAIPRSDNVDRMTYELARQIVGTEKRLRWDECSAEDIQRIEVGNYRALLIHGDEVGRTGFASPMTMVAQVARWQSGAYPWPFTDCYVGHYHVHQEFSLPNGRGSVYYTGSTESDNRYARDTMGSSALPSQRLMFIDPEGGRTTATYKVWVD
jgi:hypothetical protein